MIAAIIPTLNEAAHIGALLDQLLSTAPDDLAEIWVADGGSTDGTCEIVAAHAQTDPRIQLINNPERIQAAGVNLAAAAANAAVTVLIRLDAHSGYPPRYLDTLRTTLVSTDADSVVVRLRTQGRECFQKAVAAVSNSPLGTGGAAHRVGGQSRWIDHGHHAAFKRASFAVLGGYDRSFKANEDAEFDVRLRRAGGRIWFASEVEVDYYPRSSPIKLARQYFRYGQGRAQNLIKNGERLRLRQLAPPALVITLLFSLICTLLTPWAVIVPSGYLVAALLAAAVLAIGARDLCLVAIAGALPCMHLGWGAGFLLTAGQAIRLQRVNLDRPAHLSEADGPKARSVLSSKLDDYSLTKPLGDRSAQNTMNLLE